MRPVSASRAVDTQGRLIRPPVIGAATPVVPGADSGSPRAARRDRRRPAPPACRRRAPPPRPARPGRAGPASGRSSARWPARCRRPAARPAPRAHRRRGSTQVTFATPPMFRKTSGAAAPIRAPARGGRTAPAARPARPPPRRRCGNPRPPAVPSAAASRAPVPAWCVPRPPRIMRQRLAVKAHQVDRLEPRQQLGMRGLDHLRRGVARHPRPARRRAPRAAWRARPRNRAIGGGAEAEDRLAVGLQHRRVHPVERGARHRAQHPQPVRASVLSLHLAFGL
jgi:hypothetical protein